MNVDIIRGAKPVVNGEAEGALAVVFMKAGANDKVFLQDPFKGTGRHNAAMDGRGKIAEGVNMAGGVGSRDA